MGDYICHRGSCDPLRSKREYYHQGELLGVYCKECYQEWLPFDYLNKTSREKVDDGDKVVFQRKINDIVLYRRDKPTLHVDPTFQNPPNRTVLGKDEDMIKSLRVGDHISWERSYALCHHAIVVEISLHDNKVKLVHWNKVGGVIKIVKEWKDLSKQNGKLVRIDYPADIEIYNPRELVISRAVSRVGETGYDFLFENCESFATYCKTGVVMSQQYYWFVSKLTKLAGCAGANIARETKSACTRLAKYGTSEMVESLAVADPWVSGFLIIGFETCYLVIDLSHMSGRLEFHDFLRSTVERVTEFLFTTGLAVAGSFLPGLFLGIVGACAGSVIGRFIGKCIGRYIAGWIGL